MEEYIDLDSVGERARKRDGENGDCWWCQIISS